MRSRGLVAVVVCAAAAACGSFGSDASSSSSSGGPGPADAGTTPEGAVPPAPPPPPPSGPPTPELVAHAPPHLKGIAASTKYVYFATDANNSVLRVPVDATNATPETFRVLAASPLTLTVEGTTVFVADAKPSLVALPEGDVTAPYLPVTYSTAAQYLAFAAGALWWSGQDNQIHRADAACADLSVVAPSLAAPLGLASSATQMWIVASGQFAIARAGLGAATSQTVYSPENDGRAIAVAGGAVFWTRGSDKLIRVAFTGTGASDLATNAGDARSIAADDTWVYWQNEEGMYRIRHDGSSRERIGDSSWGLASASGLVVRGIALSPAYVFWIDPARGDVWRVAR